MNGPEQGLAGSQDARLVDLHCHSSASGGAIGSPDAIAALMRQLGYAAFSLTEHQSLDSLEDGQRAAAAHGLEYVNGIEISVRLDDPDAPDAQADILGYLFEPTPALRSLAEDALERSMEWVRGGIERLCRRGIAQVTDEDLQAAVLRRFGPQDRLKRPLRIDVLAEALRHKGLLREDSPVSLNDQARALLSEVYPLDELPPMPTARRACEALAEAGAVRILAHPGGQRQPSDEQLRRLSWWLDRHVDGLEVYTPKNLPEYQAMALELCRKRNAPYSGGSDRHSYHQAVRKSQAPYRCLLSLKEFKARR